MFKYLKILTKFIVTYIFSLFPLMETERAMDNKWSLLKVQGHMARKKLLIVREIKSMI